jgi:glutamyl-tRNA synthetase
MRTKEYELRNALYFAMLQKLELRPPQLIEFSRLAIKNAPISKRLITPLIESGKVEGWDDPRLPTLKALKRRGILPEAIREFVLSFGLSKVESEPNWDALLSHNRKLLDERCMRRFFVRKPMKLAVVDAPAKEAVLKNHPTKPEMGERKIAAAGTFFIAGPDADAILPGETFRLKDLYNVTLVEKTSDALVAKYEGDSGLAAKKIQWVPTENAVLCKVKIPKDLLDDRGEFNPNSMEEETGVCEPSCRELAEGTSVQFERYGYVRMDKKEENGLVFVFSC